MEECGLSSTGVTIADRDDWQRSSRNNNSQAVLGALML